MNRINIAYGLGLVAMFLLIGWGCKNKFASVNVNVNAAAQAAVNASKSVNASDVARQAAVAQAKAIYITEEAKGRDFSSGPCLSNRIMTDWAVDLVHNPRTEVDDQSENQCASYRNKAVKHLVELDLDGQLVKAE